MTYSEVIDYLYSRLPMFTRDGASAFKKDLTNTLELCQALGNPQEKFRAVHIAGTNGKGSSSHMLASISQAAGYRTGLYTSPHLLDFRERIKINGEMVPEDFVVNFVQTNQSLIEKIQPSFFELTVAMAFLFFAESGVDIAIIETGLGGRLDSTNIIRPIVSLITNISFDHMNMLGNDLPSIAYEKAGIIKENVPIVISEKQEEVANVFIKKAETMNAPLLFASEAYQLTAITLDTQYQYVAINKRHTSSSLVIKLDLRGSYQQKNLLGVLTTVDQLNLHGFPIGQEQILEGLAAVQKNTGLLGRWQTLSTHPLVICDTGHNEGGWLEVIKNIQANPFRSLHMVLGVLKDKDLGHMLDILPKTATYYFCSPKLNRALPGEQLQGQALAAGLTGEVFNSIEDAVKQALAQAGKEDLIFIGGSTFVVAEALPVFGYQAIQAIKA